MSTKFHAELRRHYYTTPKSYLDLIALYLQLLQEKRYVSQLYQLNFLAVKLPWINVSWISIVRINVDSR